MIVDFCIPDPGQSMLAAYQDWRRKSEKAASDYGFHMAVTSWSKMLDEMEIVVTARDGLSPGPTHLRSLSGALFKCVFLLLLFPPGEG